MSKITQEITIDAMTGFQNYEGFLRDMDELTAVSAEVCEDLSLAMIDIDFFKKVNEEYGHEIGDKVILSIAQHIRANTPDTARLYRYAGDQFAMLLPSTEKERAFLIIERIRDSYSTSFENKPITLDVTISAGLACFPHDGTRTADVIRKAEGALYRAKSGSRNKVCLSREEKMVTKTSHYTFEQLKRLSDLAKREGLGEAILLREALDDLLKKYDY